MEEKPTVDDVLIVGTIAGMFGAPGLSALCGGAYLAKKTAEGTIGIGKALGKGTAKVAGSLLKPCKRGPRPPKRLTRRQRAEVEKRRLMESLRILDSLPLDDDEKEAIRQHARRQLVKKLWEIMQ